MSNRRISTFGCVLIATICISAFPAQSGSRAVTVTQVADIFPGPSSSAISQMTAYSNMLIFVANNGAQGAELWRSHPVHGTTLLKDINPAGGSFPGIAGEANGVLLFTADDGVHGVELWRTDGTSEGTYLLKDIHTAGSSNPALLSYFDQDGALQYAVNGVAYFTATDPSTGNELWKTDGTVAGTVQVRDINAGAGSSGIFSWAPLNGKIYFGATDASNGSELWVTDGTSAGTTMVSNFNSGGDGFGQFLAAGPSHSPYFNGKLWLTCNDGAHGWELGYSDGSGVVMVKDLNPLGDLHISFFMAPLNDKLIFIANDATSGWEPYVTDGTSAGTFLLKDIDPAPGVGSCGLGLMPIADAEGNHSFSYNGAVLLVATNSTYGEELWRTDGTVNGTTLIKDIDPGVPSSSPGAFNIVNGKLVFSAFTLAHQAELWVSDGTEAGTLLLRDINPGGSGAPYGIGFIGSTLFFSASDGTTGRELWSTDGTVVTRIMDINTAGDSDPSLGFLANRAILLASTPAAGAEPFYSDGTAANTYLISDIEPSTASSNASNFVPAGDKLFFVATTSTAGQELYAIELVTVADPPIIVSSLNQGATLNAPFSYQLQVLSHPSLPLIGSMSGLPAGLTFDALSGIVSGTPTASGSYAVTITVTNGAGTDTDTLLITVPGNGASASGIDSDTDGFPDELESELGTDPKSAASTPFGGSTAGVVQDLANVKANIKLNFAKGGSGTIAFSGTIQLAAGYKLVAGQTFVVDVGGVVKSFTLDEKGKSPRAVDQVAVKVSKTGLAKYLVKLGRDTLSSVLADEGFDDTTVKTAQKTLPVVILFNSTYYFKNVALLYSATKGKTAKTTQPR